MSSKSSKWDHKKDYYKDYEQWYKKDLKDEEILAYIKNVEENES